MAGYDSEVYGRLLAEARPVVIESEEEHDRMLAAAEALMEKGEALSAEERKLLELLVYLIESFERSIEEDDEEVEEAASAKPHETLGRLLAARGLELNDVAHIFGNPSVARAVVSGERPISRNQAKELARFFRVPAKIFS